MTKKIVLKGRSKGLTTATAQVSEEEEKGAPLPEETPEYLNALLRVFTFRKEAARSRLDRVVDLMSRKKALKWSYDKQQKMQRRLKAAAEDMEQMSYACTEVTSRLEKR
jgi:hypothetical protein